MTAGNPHFSRQANNICLQLPKGNHLMSEKVIVNTINEKITSWLDRNRDAFGRKILCSGIDVRTAVHISHLFPDSSIVLLIDDPAEEKEGALNEPLMIRQDIKAYQGGLFDTVVCFTDAPLKPAESLTDRDKITDYSGHWLYGNTPYPDPERGSLYLYRASRLMDYYESAAGILRNHLKRGGTLLHLVRSEHDEHLLGYCLALASEEMNVDPSHIRQILCRENGASVILQGIRAVAGERTNTGALIAENLNFSLDRMNTAAVELQGHDAEILLQADMSGLIRGYHLYQKDSLAGKLALYTSANRKDVIYYFTDVQGDVPYLRRFHTDDKDKLLRHMVGELHRQKASDSTVHWVELVLNDDWSESEK
jgi:hypothetical protein